MTSKEVTLRFCASCGVLLHPALGTEENPECENCGSEVRTALQRVEGTFKLRDANILEVAHFGDRVSMVLKEKAS